MLMEVNTTGAYNIVGAAALDSNTTVQQHCLVTIIDANTIGAKTLLLVLGADAIPRT